MPNAKRVLAALAAALVVSGCGFQSIPQAENAVTAAWGEVQNQYQRRADLVPNLVETVRGYATHERETLEGVIAARAKATQVQLNVNELTPENLKKFEEAQAGLRSALGRLMAVAENYPQLKADAGFRDLQAQLEGTENRIAVARNRFIDAVRTYNTTARSFPSNLWAMAFGFSTRPTFTVEDEKAIAKPPTVNFGNEAPAAPPAPQ